MGAFSITNFNLAVRLGRGVAWSLTGAIVNSTINLGLSIFLARVLGKEGFGKFSIVQSTMLTAAGVAQLAMGYTANKYVAEFRISDKMKTARIIGFCSVFSWITAVAALMAIVLSAPWLAVTALAKPQLSSSLVAASGMVFFSVLSGFQIGVLAGLESYKRLAQATAAGAIANLLVCILGAWAAGIDGLVVGLSLGALLQWFMYRHALWTETRKQGVSPIYRNLYAEKAIFYRFALPAAASGFVSMPAFWLANSFLVREANGIEEIAVFSAANTLRSLVLFLPVMFNKVTTSLLNNFRGPTERGSYGELFHLNLFVTSAIAVIGAALVAILGPRLLGAFGKTFLTGSPVLYIMLLVTTMEVIFQAVYQLIQSNERMWLSLFAVVIPRDISSVVLAFVFVPKWGAAGLAAAYGGSWLLALILVCFLSLRYGLLPKSP